MEYGSGTRSDRKMALILAVQISVFSIAFFVGAVDLAGRAFARPAPVSASALEAVKADSKTPLTPARIEIPSLKINAPVEKVGVNWLGNMAVPVSFDAVGWYKHGPKPGESGNAVLAGHLSNSVGLKGVFGNLRNIKKGDKIFVYANDGSRISYEVVRLERRDLEESPEGIFTEEGEHHLVLITCEGEYIPEKKTYTERLLVYAKPINP